MATFRRLPSNKWHAVIRRKGEQPIAKSFLNKLDAEKWARNIETQLDQGNYKPISELNNITVGEAIDRYAREVTPLKKGADQEFRRLRYLKSIFGQLAIHELKSKHLAAHRDKRLKSGVSGQTIIHELNIISRVFNVARTEWGYTVENPVSMIAKPKKSSGRTRRLEAGEYEKLLQTMPSQLRSAVDFAIETAMRRSELLSLRWQDVNFTERTALLRTTKTGGSRLVPLSSKALEILNELPESSVNVFTLTPSGLSHGFKRAAVKAGIQNICLHDLRHEGTSRLFEKGLNTMETSLVTGHKTLSCLKRYTHLRAADLAQKLG